jgi:hypothetical protein
MKITDLTFADQGCCGEHKRAQVDMPDGRTLHIFNHGEAGYRVVQMQGGMVCAPIQAGLDAAAVESLLP